MVWSYPTNEVSQKEYFIFLFAVSSFFNTLQCSLFYKGIVIRGGISIGDLFIEGNKIFGPALIRAYKLEKKAIYPRIVVDKEIFDKKLNHKFKDFFSQLHFKQEADFYYLNYFSQIEVINKLEKDGTIKQLALSSFIEPLVMVINRGILIDDIEVRKKYEWLRDQLLSIKDLDFDWTCMKESKNF